MSETTIDKKDLIAIRSMRVEDLNFIYSTMLKGIYFGDPFFRKIPKDIFMENYHKVITRILQSPNNDVRVACLKDDIDTLLAYAILNKAHTNVSFVYCKANWRKIGLAKDLVPATVRTASHTTKVGLDIMIKHDIVFNPFL